MLDLAEYYDLPKLKAHCEQLLVERLQQKPYPPADELLAALRFALTYRCSFHSIG